MTSIVAASIIGIVVALIVGLAYYLWYAVALSVVFARLGSPSWKGWVPIVNEAEILVLGGVPAWSVVYYFIPIVSFYGLYLKITAVHRINLQFRRGAGMTVLGILLPPVWASILAWGRAPASEFDERVMSMLPASDAGGVGPLSAGLATAEPATPVARDASGYSIPEASSRIPSAPSPFAPAAPLAPEKPVVALVPAPIVALVPAPPVFAPPLPPPVTTVNTEQPAAPVNEETAERLGGAPGFIVNPWAPPSTESATHKSTPVVPPPVAAAKPVDLTKRPLPPPAEVEADAPAAEPEVIVSVLPTLTSAVAEEQAHPAPATVDDPVVEDPLTGVPTDDEDDEYAATVVVDRRPRLAWSLLLDSGKSFPITADRVALGRNPVSDDPDTQLLSLPDSTRTLSKTHATLRLDDGEWTVTDLNSTNGVVVVGDEEAETLLAPGRSSLVPGRFILGKVGMRVDSDSGRRP